MLNDFSLQLLNIVFTNGEAQINRTFTFLLHISALRNRFAFQIQV